MPSVKPLYTESGGPTQTTTANVTNGAKLGAASQTGASYDGCINQGPSCTAAVQAKN